jgi:hypothetical protein
LFGEGRFETQIRVYEVIRSLKFPDGYKVRCALIEKKTGVLRVLLDNHEPFGYHLHTKLPLDKSFRVAIDVKTYNEAIAFFMKEVRKVVENEI